MATRLAARAPDGLPAFAVAAALQRCILVHEHFHAIIETGIDVRGGTARGAVQGDIWQRASALNEALAAWMELHYTREQADSHALVQAYVQSGEYPQWPYAGAARIERIHQQEGLDGVRRLITSLRDDPEAAQATFDARPVGSASR